MQRAGGGLVGQGRHRGTAQIGVTGGDDSVDTRPVVGEGLLGRIYVGNSMRSWVMGPASWACIRTCCCCMALSCAISIWTMGSTVPGRGPCDVPVAA